MEYFKKIPLDVLENVFYDPDTGEVFITKGSLREKDGRVIYRHSSREEFPLPRILWTLETGEDPGEFVVDHVDTNPFNQKFSNLRLATKAQNAQNRTMHTNNTSGVKGVYWDRTANMWRARVYQGSKVVWSQYYRKEELELAAKEISEARKKLHGEFANNG